MAIGATASAAVRHVDGAAPPGGDGSSWSSAHRFLSDALSTAQPGDEVRVAHGVYRPDRSDAAPTGTGDRTATFAIGGGVALRGGYAGLGAADPDAQDPWGTPSMLSGDLLGNDDSAGGGIADNSAHVVTVVGDGALLFGCHVLRGNANLPTTSSPNAVGGGVYGDGHTIAIEQCRIAENHATWGAGIFVREVSAVIVRDSLLANNAAPLALGGAIRVFHVPTLEIHNCEFRENIADAGAAISHGDATNGVVKVFGSAFVDNVAAGPAGAIHCKLGVRVEATDTLFAGNGSVTSGAGAVLATNAPSTFVRCAFLDNGSAVGAGGLFLVSAGSPAPDRVASCLIAGNGTSFFGGGVYAHGPGQFVNCMIAQNGAVAGAGVMCEDASPFAHCTIADNAPDGVKIAGTPGLAVVHSIFWHNGAASLAGNPAQATVTRSLIDGGWSGPGGGNIAADPLFVAADARDYRLGEASPALDAGDLALVPMEIVDLDGDGVLGPLTVDALGAPRVQGAAPDLGAFEGSATARIPQDSIEGLPPGETVVLTPESSDPWAGATVAASVSNAADASASFALAQIGWAIHPGAGGLTEEGLVAALASSLPPGDLFAHIRVPIGASQAPDQNATVLRPTVFDPSTNSWRLAVVKNVNASPGHAGPTGDFLVLFGDLSMVPPLSQELGDHGVFWDPARHEGFVWANVDGAGDFGVGRKSCDADIAPSGGDGIVDGIDLGAVLATWGASGDGDITKDGVVDAADLAALLASWGDCNGIDGGLAEDADRAEPLVGKAPGDKSLEGQPLRGASTGHGASLSRNASLGRNALDRERAIHASSIARGGNAVHAPRGTFDRRRADLDRDGRVGGGDLGLLMAAWGEATDRATRLADLDGNGRVDGADLGLLLGAWTM
ncbi:MAG: right-handed parallel beta-helix repeat-containing protein [Phycisphaerales bacterium]